MNCSLSTKPRNVCNPLPPSPPSLSVCLHPSLTYRLMHILAAPISYALAHTAEQVYTAIQRAIFVCSLQCFLHLCNSPLYKRAGGRRGHRVWYTRSGGALRCCLCSSARLDADQGRILADLWDLTLFRVLRCSRCVRSSAWRGSWKQQQQGMCLIKTTADLQYRNIIMRPTAANKTQFNCVYLLTGISICFHVCLPSGPRCAAWNRQPVGYCSCSQDFSSLLHQRIDFSAS